MEGGRASIGLLIGPAFSSSLTHAERIPLDCLTYNSPVHSVPSRLDLAILARAKGLTAAPRSPTPSPSRFRPPRPPKCPVLHEIPALTRRRSRRSKPKPQAACDTPRRGALLQDAARKDKIQRACNARRRALRRNAPALATTNATSDVGRPSRTAAMRPRIAPAAMSGTKTPPTPPPAQSRLRRGSGEPALAGASPVPAQMWQRPVLVQMW